MGRLDCYDCERASIDNHDFRCTRGANCIEKDRINPMTTIEKRGPGRPRNPPDKSRDFSVVVKLTPDEYEWVSRERFRRELESKPDVFRALLVQEIQRQGETNG